MKMTTILHQITGKTGNRVVVHCSRTKAFCLFAWYTVYYSTVLCTTNDFIIEMNEINNFKVQ
jgi:hypothetical protein